MNNMKKAFIFLFLVISLSMFGACDNTPVGSDDLTEKDLVITYLEMKKSFEFFWNTSMTIENAPGYGLARDRYPNAPNLSSIAATGFALAAYAIGANEGWITFEEGYERTLRTVETLATLNRNHGFYYHFYEMYSGQPSGGSEVSIIDTGLMIIGGIVALEYFGGEVAEKFQAIYDAIEWEWYVDPARNMFRMGYKDNTGFAGHWDHMAEQLILYVLAAGSSTYPTDNSLYNTVMAVEKSQYKGGYLSSSDPSLNVEPFYYTYNGSLFQHQFSQAFIDFRDLDDPSGINWFTNGTLAAKANYAYTQDHSDTYKTYGKTSWGITASDGPGEYNAYGSKPAKNNTHNGTIAPYGALASINYMPKEAAFAAKYYYTVEGLWDTYGFKDAFNLGPVNPSLMPTLASKTPWIAEDYIGIDKGITMVMISNYKNQFVWNQIMKNENIQNGLEVLGFTKVS